MESGSVKLDIVRSVPQTRAGERLLERRGGSIARKLFGCSLSISVWESVTGYL